MDGSIGLVTAFIVVLGAVFYTQLEAIAKRIRFLETAPSHRPATSSFLGIVLSLASTLVQRKKAEPLLTDSAIKIFLQVTSYSAFTCRGCLVSTAKLLRSGKPNTGASISNTSPA